MPTYGVIEDIPLNRGMSDKRVTTGLVRALFAMQPGQSALFDTTYYSAHVAISKARRRKRLPPLEGQFIVVEEENGVRVGRVI